MKHKGLIIAGIVVAVLILAVLAVPFFIDANQFKPKVESEARAAPGQFSVQDLSLKDGRIDVVQGGKKRTYENVNVSLQNVSEKSAFPFSVDATAPGGGTLKVQGTAGPLNSGDMTATPLTANVSIKGLDLAATGFVPAQSGLAGTLDYDGTIKSDGKKAHS